LVKDGDNYLNLLNQTFAHTGNDAVFGNNNPRISGSGDLGWFLTDYFDHRVPFKAVYEPERLSNRKFYCNDPHPSGNITGSAEFNHTNGDVRYKMLAHNFLSEVVDFFLYQGEMTRFVGWPSDDPRFGNAESGSTYKMRVKLYKTYETAKTIGDTSGYKHTVPQAIDTRETFTMYSRPTAFGPPIRFTGDYNSIDGTVSSEDGDNYSHTPPYYYGEAWADITFTPTETKKYDLYEIQNNCRVQFYRAAATSSADYTRQYLTKNAAGMQLDASLNLFGKAAKTAQRVSDDEEGLRSQFVMTDRGNPKH
jgi:hypothetical protein